ncbi:unnamed protein product [Rhodiola kirilowii]
MLFHFTYSYRSVHQALLFIASLILVTIISSSAAVEASAVILPLTKDPSTLQYLTQIQQRTPQVNVSLVVDIGGVYLWINCDTGYASSSYKSAQCGSAQCHLFKSRKCNGPCYLNVSRPGCNDNSCDVNVYNPVTGISTGGEVTLDLITVQSVDRSIPGRSRSVLLNQFPFTCTPDFLLNGLAKGASGMAGLGRGRMGIPSLLTAELSLKRRFSVCLGSKGVVLIGDVKADLSQSLSLTYTPLILNPVFTAGIRYIGDPSTDYYIGVKSININNRAVKLNSTLLKISSDGIGGTKLSSVNPYTVMESSIYNAVITAFRNEVAHIPTVAPVSPFGLCYGSGNFRSTPIGPEVPRIDLVLQSNSVKWSILGANSMVQVSDGVMCLGVVDGGENSYQMASIAIGGYQLEDVLLEFDLADSKLGFSSSMLLKGISCSDLNLTSIA